MDLQALAVCITTAANRAHHLRPNLVQKSKVIILALMNIHILSVMSELVVRQHGGGFTSEFGGYNQLMAL